MKVYTIIATLTAILLTGKIQAWDEVTHAYMTRMIPDLVEDQKLKKLLNDNLDEYVYGCWYTDTYQYTKNRIDELNPHRLSAYGKAFTAYLSSEEVRQQDNYEQLVALYLGSLSHILEDFWYDTNLNPYQRTKNDKFKGDSRHGAFVIKQNGYLNLKVKRYFPVEDLFQMYSDAGMLGKGHDTPEAFKEMMDEWSNEQYLMLRSLKFINFVGGNQMHNQSLWTAGNLVEIQGGMKSSAVVAAKFIEAMWKKLNDLEAPYFLHAEYFPFENKIAVLASNPLSPAEYSSDRIKLVSSTGDTIPGTIDQYSHPIKKKDLAEFSFSFYPLEKLVEGESYRIIAETIADPAMTGSGEIAVNSRVYEEKQGEPKPFLSTLGMGIFGLIPMIGISFILFGIAGFIKFSSNNLKKNLQYTILIAVSFIFRFAGLVALVVGLYLLFTNGALIIDLSI